MSALKSGELVKALADIRRRTSAEVLFVYLREAHAIDSWPLSPDAIPDQRSLADRQSAGQTVLDTWPEFAEQVSECFIDTLDDTTTIANGFWPERYVVVRKGRVVWASSFMLDRRCQASGSTFTNLRDAALAAWC